MLTRHSILQSPLRPLQAQVCLSVKGNRAPEKMSEGNLFNDKKYSPGKYQT